MRREFRTKTASLGGTSDLTVLAPIRPGFVPALDAVTYATRVRRLLRALHQGRRLGHEQDLARVMSDAVERVGRIHAVRIAVLEPEADGSGPAGRDGAVLLAATFDGAWESYVRTIWQKVARLLDLIYCNTIDYQPGALIGFEAWGRWLRSRQVETPFLYATPGIGVEDIRYHVGLQRALLRGTADEAERRAMRQPVLPAERVGLELVTTGTDPGDLGHGQPLPAIDVQGPAFRQGLRALVGLHRLGDLYPPGDGDGDYLVRAAIELLPEFARLAQTSPQAVARAREQFPDAIDWFRDGLARHPSTRRWRRPPALPAITAPDTVQAGILAPLPDGNHGVLLLLAFGSAQALAGFLGRFVPTTEGRLPEDRIVQTLAVTPDGLRRAGLGEDELRQWPEDFVQGMAARAGLLGDLRVNHPSRWRLPGRNWALGVAAPDLAEHDPAERIALSSVHAVLQLRLADTTPAEAAARAALMARLQQLVGTDPDVVPLSLQWMHRLRAPAATPGPATAPAGPGAAGATREHFGFGDGMAEPVFTAAEANPAYPNHVHVGEVLVGYGNAADEPPVPEGTWPADDTAAGLMHNGSFLAVRKLRQDLAVLEQALAASVIDRDTTLAKMMGRWPADHPRANQPLVPLANPARLNDFHYRGDPEGRACPFHAHIRRANPRDTQLSPVSETLRAGSRPPQLFRRSLSYGPLHDRQASDPAAREASLAQERGLVFMAYGASLAEQFEVVQRWLAGGSPPGTPSAPSDPFFGVPEGGRQRHYRFEHDGRVVRLPLDGSDRLHEEPRPIVRLEWGLYAFAPSTRALRLLAARAAAAGAAAAPARRLPWDAQAGEAVIARLQGLEAREGCATARVAWKAALEDADASAEFGAASVWAAVRARPGGCLRTPYGVLAASPQAVDEALRTPLASAGGYLPRMAAAYGPIFLGQDAGDGRYEAEAPPALAALASLSPCDTYVMALDATQHALQHRIDEARASALQDEAIRRHLCATPCDPVDWERVVDLRELVDALLAHFCEQWFGLSEEGGHFARGGYSWRWQPGEPARYPGHFIAPSRWFFQPHPGAEVGRIGAAHGQALRQAMDGFLAQFGSTLSQPSVTAVLGSSAAERDPGYASRTLLGLIMGFVPTVDAVLRRVLAQWWTDGTLWALRDARERLSPADLERHVDEAFRQAMQLRTVPELIWRTARDHGRLGGADGVDLVPGDVVVIGLASATQQALAAGSSAELGPAFGGDRAAAGAPTHACPGRTLAQQMMKGFVMALVTSPLPLRPGPSAVSFVVRGRAPFPATDPAGRPGTGAVAPGTPPGAPAATGPAPAAPGAGPAPLVCWAIGDSWLSDLHGPDFPDLVTALAAHGCRVVNHGVGHAEPGYTLMELAGEEMRERLVQALGDAYDGLPGSFPRPQLILLDGGGNDLAGSPDGQPQNTWLAALLRDGATRPEDAVDEGLLDQFLAQRRADYERLLDTLAQAAPGVPILVHAYDHPIPAGHGPAPGWPTWLQPVFAWRRQHGLALTRPVMRHLIDRLNGMVATLAADQQARGRPVHHLDLRGQLAALPDFGDPGDADTRYRRYWDDELHPTAAGYEGLARAVAAQIAALGWLPGRSGTSPA